MFLSDYDFSEVIRNTPLISIDLCILKGREILLGKRINSPAKDFFFVPGGRILKSETRKDTLTRILRNELGLVINSKKKQIKFLGVFEHFYKENFFGNNEFGTHYVVLAYLIPFEILTKISNEKIKAQHSEYLWFNIDNKRKYENIVHQNSLEYFKFIK